MPRLKWTEMGQSHSRWIRATNVINLDLIDLCKDRYWGSHVIHMTINFSIHERASVGQEGWTHQLLAPNGVHIYLNSEEEGKEIAEVIYGRILAPLIAEEVKSQKGTMLNELARNKTKHKRTKLQNMISDRRIHGIVFYSNKTPKGWMFDSLNGGTPQRLGYDFAQAASLIEKGILDFVRQ